MKQLGCDYQGYEFGASYIDSCCIDGFLWDLDSVVDGDMLSCGGDIPCPQCNHEAWIEYAVREDVEEDGYIAFFDGKTINDCPFFDGCKLRYPEDWEKYREFWTNGFNEAKDRKRGGV